MSKKIAVIGECMIELSEKGADVKRGFGGDTLNTSVYIARQVDPAALTVQDVYKRQVWERSPQDQEKFWVKYLRDFISLIGLLIALIVTLSITSVAGSAQQMIDVYKRQA